MHFQRLVCIRVSVLSGLLSVIQLNMYEIIPNLFLSSFRDLKNTKEFFVINASKDLPMVENSGEYRVWIDDAPSENVAMYNSFSSVVPMIRMELSENKKVVVHCFAGQQRSPAIIAAYLMSQNPSMSVDQTIQFIKSKKPDAFAGHVTFYPALQLWKQKKIII